MMATEAGFLMSFAALRVLDRRGTFLLAKSCVKAIAPHELEGVSGALSSPPQPASAPSTIGVG